MKKFPTVQHHLQIIVDTRINKPDILRYRIRARFIGTDVLNILKLYHQNDSKKDFQSLEVLDWVFLQNLKLTLRRSMVKYSSHNNTLFQIYFLTCLRHV